MSDPKRWLDDGSGATDLERDLLGSAGDVEPPPAARADVWAAMANRLPPGGGGGSGGGGPSAGGGGLGGAAIKIVAGIAVVSAAAIGAIAVLMMRSSAPNVAPIVATTPPSVDAPPSASAVSPGPSASTTAIPEEDRSGVAPSPVATTSIAKHHATTNPARPPSPSPATSVASAPPASSRESTPIAPTASATTKVDALREENALLAQARQSLRQGDAPGALAKVESAKARFPNGALVQEREVLAIEALAQSGNSDAASRRATAFVQAFPSSPHASHVRTFVR